MAVSKRDNVLLNGGIFNQGPQILENLSFSKFASQKTILVDVCRKNVTAPEAIVTLSVTDLV